MQTRSTSDPQSVSEVIHELRSALTPAFLLLGRLESDSSMSKSNLEDLAVIRSTLETQVELIEALRNQLQ